MYKKDDEVSSCASLSISNIQVLALHFTLFPGTHKGFSERDIFHFICCYPMFDSQFLYITLFPNDVIKLQTSLRLVRAVSA